MYVTKELDIEYRFDDKIRTTANNSRHEEWGTMTLGNGRSTFTSKSRVKLPSMKPIVFGVIKFFKTEVLTLKNGSVLICFAPLHVLVYFLLVAKLGRGIRVGCVYFLRAWLTCSHLLWLLVVPLVLPLLLLLQVHDDGEEGPKKDMVCLQRFPKEVFGDGFMFYPVTELDAHKVRVGWNGAEDVHNTGKCGMNWYRRCLQPGWVGQRARTIWDGPGSRSAINYGMDR